jgi:hypothetical protein
VTLDQASAALAKARRRFLAELEPVDEDAFSRVPAGESWGPAHVVEHLVRVETRVVRGARQALEKGSRTRPSAWDPLRKLPYWTGLASMVRIRTVAGADPVLDPPPPLERAAQLERFASARADTLGLVTEVQGRALSRIWLRHPFFGAFALPDMLGWVAWHEERHRAQLARILRVLHSR